MCYIGKKVEAYFGMEEIAKNID